MTAMQARTIGVAIDRPWEEVYAFAAAPERLPQWASGLGCPLQPAGDEWVSCGPDGPIRVRFAARNTLGVLDHHVRLPSGSELYVPLRVVANGSGSLVMLTLFRAEGTSAERFEADAEWVARDLAALKALLERPPEPAG